MLAINNEILPVEVKAGAPGRMKSLQLFLESRDIQRAVRFSGAKPVIEEFKTTPGKKLYSLPLYFVEPVDRLLASA